MANLANAVKHFEQKIAGKKVAIEVPEWGTKDKPFMVYMRPLSCCSVKVKSKAVEIMVLNTVECMVDVIILLATDRVEDKSDRFLFEGKDDRRTLLTKVDSEVLQRIFDAWVDSDNGDSAEIKKQ